MFVVAYILWDADLRMQVLGHAWLAAVANIDDPDLTEIYEGFDLRLLLCLRRCLRPRVPMRTTRKMAGMTSLAARKGFLTTLPKVTASTCSDV